MEGAERDVPAHSVVQEERVAEATALGGGGGAGSLLQCIRRLWATPVDADLLLIPGAGVIGGGQQLTDVGK